MLSKKCTFTFISLKLSICQTWMCIHTYNWNTYNFKLGRNMWLTLSTSMDIFFSRVQSVHLDFSFRIEVTWWCLCQSLQLLKPWLLQSVLLLSLNYYRPTLIDVFYWRRMFRRVGLHFSSLHKVTGCVGALIQVINVDHIHFLNHSLKEGEVDFLHS